MFDFEDRELSVITEEGEDNFLEMNRTWMNEEGGDVSFIKFAEKNKPIIQNFGRSKKKFKNTDFSVTKRWGCKSTCALGDVTECQEDNVDFGTEERVASSSRAKRTDTLQSGSHESPCQK